MPKIEIKGLKGLSGLTPEERERWRQQNAAKLKGKDLTYEDKLYANQQFIKKYGMDTFRTYNKAQRDEMYKTDIVQEAFDKSYGKNPNYNELNSLTTEGKISLFDKGYVPQAEIDSAYNAQMTPEKVKERAQQAFDAQKWVPAMAGAATQNVYTNIVDAPKTEKAAKEGTNEDILKTVVAEDNRRKQDSVSEDVDALVRSWQASIDNNEQLEVDGKKMSYTQYINDTFEKLARGSEETTNNGFGNVTKVNPGSRYYKAFKNSSEMENLTMQDKMKFLANYMAMTRKYGEGDAISNLETQMQDYVSDNQSGWTWAGQTLKNIWAGGVANIFNKVMGLEGLYIEAVDGKESLANWVEGKNDDGSERSFWTDPKYWEGVDQFNTFDADEIKRAEENGGISQYQNITRAGEERGGWATANEALKMSKFLWSDYLTGRVLGGLGKGLTKGVGKISTGNWAQYGTKGELLATSGRAANYANKTAAIGNVLMSGEGIAEAYGMQTYNQTLQEANELLDEQIDKEANEYAQNIINSEEGQANINAYVQREMARRRAQNDEYLKTHEGASVIVPSEDELRRQGTALYTEVLTQQYKKDPNNSHAEDRQYARLKAADAYMVDATIEEMRMAAGNFAFKKYLFGKNTRAALGDNNPFLGNIESDAAGNLASTTNKAWNTTKKVLTPVWDGFQSNYLDDVTVGFGKGFGLGEYNNYLAQKYNPEKAIAANLDWTSQFISGLEYGMKGAKEASMNSQSFYDGFVGALGSIISFTPRFTANERQQAMDNMGVKNGDNLSFARKFNKWVMNPLVNNYYESQGQINQAQEFLDLANSTIARKRDALQDITNVVTALNMREAATSQGKTTLEAKNAKANQALQLVTLLDNWSKDPVLSQSKLVQTAQSTLEGIANGTIEQEQMDNMITQFLGQGSNKSIADLPNAREVAAETIKKNANQMLQMQKTVQEVSKTIEDSKLGKRLTKDQKAQLTYQLAMKDNWKSRVSEMEKEINGQEEVSDSYNSNAEYGSLKSWERKKAAQEKAIEDVDTEISTLEERLAKTEEKQSTAKNKRKELYTPTIESLKVQIKSAKERKATAEERLKQIEDDHSLFVDSEGREQAHNTQVLSKDEILALNPQQRAWMLNKNNLSDYSAEQQKVIKETITELQQKNPDIMETIKDVDALNEMVKANDEAYAKLTDEDNAVAAATWAQSMLESRDKAMNRVWKAKAQQMTDDIMNKAIAADEKAGTTAEQTHLKEAAKSIGYDALMDYIKRTAPATTQIGNGEITYHHPLFGIAQVLKVQNDAANAINTLFKDDNQAGVRAALSQAVYGFTSDAESKEQAMSQLEDAIDAQTNETAKAQLEAVMKKMEELNYQRDATKVTNREELARKKQEEAAAKDGNNYGWNGYKVGDVVFNETRGKGTIISFGTNRSNGNKTRMTVKFEKATPVAPEESATSDTYTFNSEFDKGIITKDTPMDILDTGKSPKNVANTQETTEAPKENLNRSLSESLAPNRGLAESYLSDENNIKDTPYEGKTISNWDSALKTVEALVDKKASEGATVDDIMTSLGSREDYNLLTTGGVDVSSRVHDYIVQKVNDYQAGENTATDESKVGSNEELQSIDGDVKIETTPQGDIAKSPSIEEQASRQLGVEVQVIPTQDLTEQGNRYNNNSADLLAGNFRMGYDAKELAETGKQKPKVGSQENDSMNQFNAWLKETNTKLQDIIDNELGRIIADDPETKIQFLQIRPEQGSSLQKDMIEVIEYTSKVKKFHDENNGGVITANGKQWLVVGVMGYTNVAQRQNYNEMQHSIQVNRKAYFDANPEERYYVDPVYYSNFDSGTSGYVTRQLADDSEVQLRRVGDLADGKKSARNPEGLKLDELKWGIQQGDKLVTVGVTDRNTVYPPKDRRGNSGNVFLLVKAANGNYIPIYVKPVMLSELVEGSELKNQINGLINDLTSTDYNDRVTAIRQLVQMLNLTDEDNILIGDRQHQTISIKQNGNIVRTFNLDASFNRAEFQKAINDAHFRVNITTSTLQNPTALKMYNDAGALITDAAKLGTSNMVYSIYPCGKDGKPIIKEDVSWNNTPNRASNGELSKKYTHSVLYNGKTYRERDGVFYDEVDHPVDKESSLYEQLYWNQFIQSKQLEPAFSAKGNDYYIIRNSSENPQAVKRDRRGNVKVATEDEARKAIDYASNLASNDARAKAAEAEVAVIEAEDAAKINEQMNAIKNGTAVEEASPDMLPNQNLTQEQLAQQFTGNFEGGEKASPVVKEDVKEEVKPAPQAKRDVNETGSKSLSSLQSSEKITTFAQVITNKESRAKLRDIFKKKGWNASKPSEMEQLLKSKGVSLQFDNVEDFLQQLEECF